MADRRNNVVFTAVPQTVDRVALENIATVRKFFGSYLGSLDDFYALWVDADPQVITPFVTEGVAVCRSTVRSGWDEVRQFWDPIHSGMTGKFDWTIDEIIVGQSPDVIITKASSDIDVETGEVWGNKHLCYQGRYLQIFKFERGKIKSFEEYYDTALLNAAYT